VIAFLVGFIVAWHPPSLTLSQQPLEYMLEYTKVCENEYVLAPHEHKQRIADSFVCFYLSLCLCYSEKYTWKEVAS